MTDRQTDRHTHRPADIVIYRAAIAAKKGEPQTFNIKNSLFFTLYISGCVDDERKI